MHIVLQTDIKIYYKDINTKYFKEIIFDEYIGINCFYEEKML